MKSIAKSFMLLTLLLWPMLAIDGDLRGACFAGNKKNTADPSLKNFKLGKQLYEKREYDQAIDALLQSIYFARNSYAPDTFYYLGLCYQVKEDHKKAIEAFKKNIEQALDGAGWGHLHLAEELVKTKQYDEAYPHLCKALTEGNWHSPLQCRAHYVEGMMEDAKGNTQAAIGYYREALGDPPWKDFDPWIAYSECMMKIKDWVDAYKNLHEMAYGSTIIKGLNFERVHLDMGICLLAKGDHQGAMDNWHRCLEYNPSNKEAHLQLAMLLDAESHFSAAIQEYKDFVRCNQDPLREGLGKDERSKQVENRIALLEQKLTEPAPDNGVTGQSPYVRMQQQRMQEQQQRVQQQKEAEARQRAMQEQMKSLPKDAGF
jgi:tetratricopeptide (TPR) repeat protein